MKMKLAGGGLAVFVLGAIALNLHDVKRYLKIRSM